MGATVKFPASGGPAFPPSLLLRNLSSPAVDRALSPSDHSFFRRRGASSKLRIGGFICCSGSPGVWGPCATSSAQLAVAEINKRGGILGREIELSIYDAGGPLDEILDRAEQAIAFDEVDLIVGLHTSAVRVALRKVTTRHRILHLHAGL